MRARASINRERDDQRNQNIVDFIYFLYSKIYMRNKAVSEYLKSVCEIERCSRDVEWGQDCILQRGEGKKGEGKGKGKAKAKGKAKEREGEGK